MYKQTDMDKGKRELKVQDWNSTPYFSLSLTEGLAGLAWHSVFTCQRCHCMFSRIDRAKVLKHAKPKIPGRKVVNYPPDVPLLCDGCMKKAGVRA